MVPSSVANMESYMAAAARAVSRFNICLYRRRRRGALVKKICKCMLVERREERKLLPCFSGEERWFHPLNEDAL